MSNENVEFVPGLSVTKSELQMLTNDPEAFERYIKFYEMKLKVQTERALAKLKIEMEEREKIQQRAFEEHKDIRQKEFAKYELSLKMEERRLEIESKESENIRTHNNEIWEYLLDSGYSREMGARNLARTVDEKIASPLVDEVLFGALSRGGTVVADFIGGEVVFNFGEGIQSYTSILEEAVQ